MTRVYCVLAALVVFSAMCACARVHPVPAELLVPPGAVETPPPAEAGPQVTTEAPLCQPCHWERLGCLTCV